MAKDDFCQVYLTVDSRKEADKIANALLVKHLVACVKQVPVASDYMWQGKIEHSDEVLLVMESRKDLFDQVEFEVAKHHSYKAFVLEATQISETSKKATVWLKGELKNGKA